MTWLSVVAIGLLMSALFTRRPLDWRVRVGVGILLGIALLASLQP